MTVLQRVPTPARVRTYLALGEDQVGGYVLDAADITWAATPAALFELHGLGFPGSPFRPDAPYLDVLRFPVSPFTQVVAATGGQTREAAAQMGGGFVDHAPFTGTGFASARDQLVPLWWLDAARLPAGAELWRVAADGSEQLRAAYSDVGAGWSVVAGAGEDRQAAASPSDVLGVFGTWRGERCLADPMPDGSVTVASWGEIPGAGMRLTDRGLWAQRVPAHEVTELHELRITCRWRGAPFLLTRRWRQADALVGRLLYLGRDSYAAEALGLEKTDAAVYEATVPIDDLSDVQAVQLTPVPIEPG